MAQESPPNPNTGNTGNTSSNYSEVRSPQFVGGSIDPTTGNVLSSSKSLAASAPPPQMPTTQLANVDVPKPPSMVGALAPAAGTYIGGAVGNSVGSALASGSTLGGAISSTAKNIGGVLEAPLGLGGGTAGSAASDAFSTGAAPVAFLGEGGTTSLAAPAASSGASSAASSVGDALSSASSIDAGVGAGVLTGAVDLLTGQKLVPSLEDAAASGVGTYIGAAIGSIIPGIGTFIGGAIGGALGHLFCHTAGTLVRMEDGTLKPIEELKLRDRVFLGGEVIGRGEVWITNLFRYRGTVVNGQHAVFEDGRWVRVKDAAAAVPVDVPQCALAYPIATEHHLMVLETHIAADVAETDEDIGAIGRLAVLNANDERNHRLAEVERHLEEILSADFDIARMQATVRAGEGDQLPSQAKNNNICPQNVRSEIAAAAAIGLPAPRRQQEQIQ